MPNLQICWFFFGGESCSFVVCSGSVSLETALPSLWRQSLWLDFQILISSPAFTHCLIHTHSYTGKPRAPKWLIAVILYTGVCFLPSLLGPFWERVSTLLLPALKDCAPTCPHPSPSFPRLISPRPPLLFVTVQPTCFSHRSRALFHTLHTVSRCWGQWFMFVRNAAHMHQMAADSLMMNSELAFCFISFISSKTAPI